MGRALRRQTIVTTSKPLSVEELGLDCIRWMGQRQRSSWSIRPNLNWSSTGTEWISRCNVEVLLSMQVRRTRPRCRCFSPPRRQSDSPVGSTEEEDFVSAPSIPLPHAPHAALRRYVARAAHREIANNQHHHLHHQGGI